MRQMLSADTRRNFENDECCTNCQHSVDVRGVEQVVCLAYLMVLQPGSGGGCRDFECKRKKPAVSVDN